MNHPGAIQVLVGENDAGRSTGCWFHMIRPLHDQQLRGVSLGRQGFANPFQMNNGLLKVIKRQDRTVPIPFAQVGEEDPGSIRGIPPELDRLHR